MSNPTSPPEIYAAQHRGDADHYATYFAGMDASMKQKVALTTAHRPPPNRPSVSGVLEHVPAMASLLLARPPAAK